MTHPNVEYWTARVELIANTNLGTQQSLTQIIANTNDETLIETLNLALSRLTATQKLAESLLDTIKDYEERAALLK